MVAVVLGALAAVIAVVLVLAPAARADGDPASDYLLSGSSFLSPYDGHISSAQQKRIDAMLQSAKAQGFPLKLAVVVTRYDLGAVPILYRKPQTYAKFLAQEDFYFWKDELLVVMPNGYGLYKAKNLPPEDKAVLAKLPKLDTTDGPALADAAERAITALAARRGLTLSTGSGSGGDVGLGRAGRDRRWRARPAAASWAAAASSGGAAATSGPRGERGAGGPQAGRVPLGPGRAAIQEEHPAHPGARDGRRDRDGARRGDPPRREQLEAREAARRHDPGRRPERLGGAAPRGRGRELPSQHRAGRRRGRGSPREGRQTLRARRASSRSAPSRRRFTLRTPDRQAG